MICNEYKYICIIECGVLSLIVSLFLIYFYSVNILVFIFIYTCVLISFFTYRLQLEVRFVILDVLYVVNISNTYSICIPPSPVMTCTNWFYHLYPRKYTYFTNNNPAIIHYHPTSGTRVMASSIAFSCATLLHSCPAPLLRTTLFSIT